VRIIWTARLVVAMAVVMVVASAVFAWYHSTGPRTEVAAQAAGPPTARPELEFSPPATSPPLPSSPGSPPAATSSPATGASPPASIPSPGTVLAHAVFSGAAKRDLTGPVLIGSRFSSGSCADQVKGFISLSFDHDEQIDYRRDSLTASVQLPGDTQAPGTYDLVNTLLTIRVGWSREGLFSQVWIVKAAQTRAVLVLRPDLSGTLTATGLEPAGQRPPGDPLNATQDVSMSWTCY
jgi:hypothetical protein